MGLLVAILVVAALLAGFLWLTSREERRGRRYFAGAREALDAKTEALAASMGAHQGTAFSRALKGTLDHMVHEVVHTVLLAVRFVERLLTRLAREIRGRRAKERQEEGTPISSVE